MNTPSQVYQSKVNVSSAIEHALDRMRSRPSEKLGQLRLADELGVSRSCFARRFRAEMGISPHQYRSVLRIRRARLMLKMTGKPLIDIALELGFCSQSHFTQSFKTHVGVTPQRFRRLASESGIAN